MAVRYPEVRPGPRGPAPPFRVECEIRNLEWEGEIPEVLQGAYFRCGPDRQFPPDPDDPWPTANADGMMSAFYIRGGQVDFRMRYVQTDRLKAERAAGRALFGGYRNPFTDDPSVAGVDRTLANTAAVWFAGRLLACKEDGLPYEIAPLTLETLGRFDFDGQLDSRTFAAHPKFDPETGEMLFFAGQIDGRSSAQFLFGVANREGRITHRTTFEAPYAGMVHDFAVTETYAVFPFVPVITDQARVEAKGPYWTWEPGRPSHFAVVPRAGGEIRWFTAPAFWGWHVMNAYEDGDRIELDFTVAARHAIFPDADGVIAAPDPFRPTRITLDLASNSGSAQMRPLSELASDFYGCDPRYVGRPYRYGFMGANDPSYPPAPGYNATVRLDHATGRAEAWWAGERSAVQEPLFVPRSADAPESDGWLMVVVNDYASHRAELRILDAARPGTDPTGVVRLPFNIPVALHGVFVPQAELG